MFFVCENMVDVDHEIAQLLAEVPRLANKEGDSYTVTFKALFDDHKVRSGFLFFFWKWGMWEW